MSDFKNSIFDIKNMGIILSESIDFMLSNDIQIVNKILHLIASQISISFYFLYTYYTYAYVIIYVMEWWINQF